jgi:hypothetical protein
MVEGFAKLKILPLLIIVAGVAALAYFGRKPYQAVATIQELLDQNRTLKQAITNLSSESQIGYAKVIDQDCRDGELFTTLKFVETARDDKTKKILEKEFTIAGDIVHFDALIVKFGSKMVMDGRTRALYLWRRIYGEKMTPQQGFPIEEPGTEPQRYRDLLKELPIKQREMFWSSIWDLANDPEKLAAHDIEAIYGNVVYSKLRPGLIYVFKINSTGQVYPEVVPDI